jgi:hypothetical protein
LAEYLQSAYLISSDHGSCKSGSSAASSAETPVFASKFKGRFKVIITGKNLEQFGLPSFITSYNAKPVLIRNTGSLIRSVNVSSGIAYAEFDINVHRFAAVPKKALSTLLDRFDKMFIDVGFCIESREDAEMPETILGCASLNKPVPSAAPRF